MALQEYLSLHFVCSRTGMGKSILQDITGNDVYAE